MFFKLFSLNFMPPQRTFHRELIIETAFKLVREYGISKLSARIISKHLNCSTAPIYSCFQSMEELEQEVIKLAKNRMLEYMSINYTDRSFFNGGIGLIIFAREEKKLYRAMFLEKDYLKDMLEGLLIVGAEKMKEDFRFINMALEKRISLLRKLWFFTQGIATHMCVGLLKDTDNDFIIDTLKETGSILIQAALEDSRKEI